MTQEELAEAVGISRSAVAQIEKNFRCPSVAVANEIAKILGCKIDELVE